MPISDPTDIANLIMWLGADTGVTLFAASSNVDLWDNQEGTANLDADGDPEANSPNVITGGAPSHRDSVQFVVGNNDFLDSIGTEATGNAYTIALAVKLPASSATKGFLFQLRDQGAATTHLSFAKETDDNLIVGRVDQVDEVVIASGFTLGTWTIVVITVTAADLVTIRIDGTERGSETVTGLTDWNEGFRIQSGAADGFELGAFLGYSRVLTGAEITDVETYLNNQWLLSSGSILGNGVGSGIIGEG